MYNNNCYVISYNAYKYLRETQYFGQHIFIFLLFDNQNLLSIFKRNHETHTEIILDGLVSCNVLNGADDMTYS